MRRIQRSILSAWFHVADWCPTSIPLPPVRPWLWDTGERMFDKFPCGCGGDHTFGDHWEYAYFLKEED